MRRKRPRGGSKVWHAPHITEAGRRQEKQRAANARAEEKKAPRRRIAQKREGARIVSGPREVTDPDELERQRLLSRLLAAEGRPSITKAADDYREGGFEFPCQQDVWLQLLEHNDEQVVCDALAGLKEVLQDGVPDRRAVLESRLRRIAEMADDPSTQEAALELRRLVSAKSTPAPPSVQS